MTEEKGFDFPMLSDPGNRVGKRYGIVHRLPEDLQKVYLQFGLNVPEHNGDDTWELPLPARLIIDRDGIIRYADINADYRDRPEPEETIEALAAL
jgi:peroxiredoxin